MPEVSDNVIMELLGMGKSMREVAAETGVSKGLVNKVKQRAVGTVGTENTVDDDIRGGVHICPSCNCPQPVADNTPGPLIYDFNSDEEMEIETWNHWFSDDLPDVTPRTPEQLEFYASGPPQCGFLTRR